MIHSIKPYRIVRGPLSGYTVSAEMFRLPSGDWECELTAKPWLERLPNEPKVYRYQFPDVVMAAQQMSLILDAAEEMSQGSFIEPVTAY